MQPCQFSTTCCGQLPQVSPTVTYRTYEGVGHVSPSTRVVRVSRWPRPHFPPSWLLRRIPCPQDTILACSTHPQDTFVVRYRESCLHPLVHLRVALLAHKQSAWDRPSILALRTRVESLLSDQRQKASFWLQVPPPHRRLVVGSANCFMRPPPGRQGCPYSSRFAPGT